MATFKHFFLWEGARVEQTFIFQHYSYRTPSPGLMLREYNKSANDIDISRIYTYSYLTEEPSMGYLRKPIDPYDKAPTSPHFHRPTCKAQKMSSLVAFLQRNLLFQRKILLGVVSVLAVRIGMVLNQR